MGPQISLIKILNSGFFFVDRDVTVEEEEGVPRLRTETYL
jgi:hypothetical protein